MNLNNLECISEFIDIDEYLDFMNFVKSHMQYPEWLGDFSKKDLEFMLKNESKIWIYYLDKIPICSMMFIPSEEKVANYGPMFVNPNYVGKNLQYQMLKKLDEYSLNLGYINAMATIHPDNIYSINNFIKDDFEFISQKEYKRGLRNKYLKKLN